MSSVLYIGNSMVLRLAGLRNRAGDTIDTATVELVTLADAEGAAVGGITLPLGLSNLGDGDYEAQIPETIEAEVGHNLYATVVAESSEGIVGTFVERFLPRYRTL